MSLVTFSCASPAASWSPTRNPDYDPGYIRTKRYHQPIAYADDGTPYSYRHGESGERTLHWAKLPAADLTAGRAFFEAIGPGKAHTFTDKDGTAYTAKQVENSLEWSEVAPGYYDVGVGLEIK